MPTSLIFFLVVNYSLYPSSKLDYFGHAGGYDSKVQLRLREEFRLYHQGSSKERFDKILNPSSNTVREFMTNAILERMDKKKMKKLNFLFGDKIELPEDHLFYGNYKWPRQIQGQYIFLQNMEWSYPLSYLQVASIPR